jgi:hypothetical protein
MESLRPAEIEEAAGELHRRIAAGLRAIGERRADRPDAERRSPRMRVAQLAATLELAAQVLAAVAAGTPPPSARIDRHPLLQAAVLNGAPTLPALSQRLEQDRRILASLARSLESRLDEQHATPWGAAPLRRMLAEVSIAEAAACAFELERAAATADS